MSSIKIIKIVLLIGIFLAPRCKCYGQVSVKKLSSQLVIPEPFTLTYKVIEKNVSAGDKIGEPDSSYIVTTSSQDGKFFQSQVDKKGPTVFYYDGQVGFCSVEQSLRHRGTIDSNMAMMATIVVPMPGVGISFLPLIKNPTSQTSLKKGLYQISGLSPMFGRGPSDQVPYLSSKTDIEMVGGIPKVLQCTLIADGDIIQKWIYNKHIQFQGIWLASDLDFVDYQGDGHGVMSPSKLFSYQLIEAKMGSVPAGYFDPTHWLVAKDVIQENRLTDGPLAFVYMPDKGTVDQQIKHAQWLQKERGTQDNESKSSALSGFLILMGLSCGVGAWVWRKRQGTVR